MIINMGNLTKVQLFTKPCDNSLEGALNKPGDMYRFKNCYITVGTTVDNGKVIGPVDLFTVVKGMELNNTSLMKLTDTLYIYKYDLMDSVLYTDIVLGKELLLGPIFQSGDCSIKIEMEGLRARFSFPEKIFNALSTSTNLTVVVREAIVSNGTSIARWDAEERYFRYSDMGIFQELVDALIKMSFVDGFTNDLGDMTLYVNEKVVG